MVSTVASAPSSGSLGGGGVTSEGHKPCSTLFNLGDVELEEVVEPLHELLSVMIAKKIETH